MPWVTLTRYLPHINIDALGLELQRVKRLSDQPFDQFHRFPVGAQTRSKRHAVGRGGKPGYPQDRLIFYAWTKPAVMMCNQCSFSRTPGRPW